MAAVLDTAPNAASDFMSVRGVCEYAGITRNSVFHAISKGRLHPLKAEGSSRFLFLRGEVIAWRHRYPWRPTPGELAALLAQGYKAEDFTPATPGELAASQGAAPTGGAGETSGALVTPADVLAYVQVMSQSVTTGAASVGGEVAERAMRPFAEAMREGAQVDINAVSQVARDMATNAIRPFADSMRESFIPLSESLAQALAPRSAPTSEDVVARQMSALRVELAQLLTRIMDAIRPMVERLAAGGYVTPEDIAPFMALIGELAGQLAGTPFYDLSPHDAPAQMPGILAAQLTPTPDGVKD